MLQSRPTRRRVAAIAVATLTAAIVPMIGTATTATAAPTELFISEYVEGSSNNKALEIFNGTGAAIDLAAGGYTVQMFFNGSTTAGLTIGLTGTIVSGDAYVLAQSSAVAAILDRADQTNSASWFNGDDAVVLSKGETVIDVIGQIGVDPGSEWGIGLTSTADNTLRRNGAVASGDANAADAFDPSVEWDGLATDSFDGLGAHTFTGGPVTDAAPAVATTSPASGATGVALAASLAVTFSEDVDVTESAFTLSCATSGSKSATVTGGPKTFTLDPTTDFAEGESCTLTVVATQVTDQDANDPPDAMTADHTTTFTTFVNQCELPYTEISAIQGSGAIVALSGSRTTEGVVVGDYEGPSPNLRGFFIQDLEGDGDPATSDGIFVFEGSNADTVSLGDVVRVTGSASESNGQSQISLSTLQKCGTSSVAPTDVTFPAASATDLERFEGMLVRLPQTMHVTEHFQLGRFGQVVLSANARLQQPTNVVAPGKPAGVLQAANSLNRIIIDDASQTQNPDPIVFGRDGKPLSASNTLRGGDTATGIVGVLNFTWGGNAASPNAYRVRPINALDGFVEFEAANARPASPPAVEGSLRVAGMNLLNYFNTFSGCTYGVGGAATDCRGAGSQVEFDRQWPKTVAAVNGTAADVVGVVEIENDGYGSTSAIATLVDQLNAATAPGTWAYVDVDTATGQVNALGTDAIKVGAIYKPAKVTPVGRTAVLNTDAFVKGGDSAERNRPALAQAFREKATGGVFTAVVNHLKSKGSPCDAPDAGDGQGNCNAVRVVAATELAKWLAQDPTATGDTDRLILGDLNAYAMEDPITTLKEAGYTNLIGDRLGADAYSYVFDGQWGYLDHALGSASIKAQVAGVADWHVNADEPSVLDYNTDFKTANLRSTLYAPDQYRVSDHDPVIVGLDLTNAAPAVATVSGPSAPVLVGTPTSVSAAFSDADELDAHTATIDWGDGTTSAGTISGDTVTGSHTYAAAGIHTVTVTVTDGWERGSSSFSSVVVYDPAAGFANGGGWIPSPAGDDLPAGKGSLQFSAKYEAG
ncbi:MAG TPA: ExeM/NucH family extracellular endonuclease, partial [Dermatophilaceae bacterium]|nr:ExeM/NucH family extracellular endonuclease [Dermatophilaceae bacterium]